MSDCIEWTRSCGDRGYGQVRNGGKLWRVHRLVWTMYRGPIPDGMLVCHSCDNPKCHNIDHLFLGTMTDNMLDMTRKFRGSAKLTEDQVREIRSSGESSRVVGRRYGVSRTAIQQIRNGRTYSHVS